MVEDTPVRTAIAEFRDGRGQLLAASLIDLLDDGVSAVYSFYHPLQPKRSLGTWSVLWLVEQCQGQGQPFVYLGYWIADSPKMAYKARFPALGRLAAGAADAIAHAASSLATGREALDLARLKNETETVGYPILPLVRQLAELAGGAGRYLH